VFVVCLPLPDLAYLFEKELLADVLFGIEVNEVLFSWGVGVESGVYSLDLSVNDGYELARGLGGVVVVVEEVGENVCWALCEVDQSIPDVGLDLVSLDVEGIAYLAASSGWSGTSAAVVSVVLPDSSATYGRATERTEDVSGQEVAGVVVPDRWVLLLYGFLGGFKCWLVNDGWRDVRQ
jgi:hypothetical protein